MQNIIFDLLTSKSKSFHWSHFIKFLSWTPHFMVNMLHSSKVIQLSHYRLHLVKSRTKYNIENDYPMCNATNTTKILHVQVFIKSTNLCAFSSSSSLFEQQTMFTNLIFCFNRNAIQGIWLLQTSNYAILPNFRK